MYDNRVAVDHDKRWQNEHNDKLVPSEHNALVVMLYVAVAAGQDCHVTGVVVVHVHSGTLVETEKKEYRGRRKNWQTRKKFIPKNK